MKESRQQTINALGERIERIKSEMAARLQSGHSSRAVRERDEARIWTLRDLVWIIKGLDEGAK